MCLAYTVVCTHPPQVACALHCTVLDRVQWFSVSIPSTEPVPSKSGLSETAPCPPSPIADNPSPLLSLTSFPPPVSDSSCLFTRCICQLYCPTVLSKVLYYKIKNVFIFCLFFYVLFVWKVLQTYYSAVGLPGDSVGKESTCNVGYLGLTQGLGRFLGEGNGYQLQYSGLENPMGSA